MIKRIIKSALTYQLVVITLFDNSSVLNDEDNVCVFNGGKSVRDDEAGFVFHKLVHRGLYLDFGARVNV